MSKLLLTSALLIFTASCITINKSQPKQAQADQTNYPEEDAYPEEEAIFPEWAGPGWYGGVYINNQNDYWNHRNNHYNQGQGGNRGRGDRGGDGRGGGGGGHGGGGHR